jgi:hypothetical protein
MPGMTYHLVRKVFRMGKNKLGLWEPCECQTCSRIAKNLGIKLTPEIEDLISGMKPDTVQLIQGNPNADTLLMAYLIQHGYEPK